MPLEFSQTNEEKTRLTVGATTPAGKPAPLDGPPVVTVQAGNGTVNLISGEPNSFFLVSSDDPGDTVYVVSADADLGDGVTTIADSVTMHVLGAQAGALTMGIGETVLK